MRSDAINEVVGNAFSKKHLDFGNMGAIKTNEVMRKIKQEIEDEQDFDKYDYFDIVKLQMHESNVNWLRHCSSPFRIICFDNDQINILIHSKIDTVYIDATGRIMRKSI